MMLRPNKIEKREILMIVFEINFPVILEKK
jgi:hypothetical protein